MKRAFVALTLMLVIPASSGFSQTTATYKSCKAILAGGASVGSGVYTIDADDGGPPGSVDVYCDMERDGGGWTLGVKSWYAGGVYGMTGSVGNVADGLTLKGNPYKLSDDVIRAIIGPSENFDVLADQNGYNSTYSTGNHEYVVLRNYTGYWRFNANQPVLASSSQTVMQSYRASDHALAWTGELLCGFGGAGINCFTVASNHPQGGDGCVIAMGTASNELWHHVYMSETNSETYLVVCNGAQYSSGHDMNHRWWFRETTTYDVDTDVPAFDCRTADSSWHATNVTLSCTATDSGSGLANPADANFVLTTSIAGGDEWANAFTNSHQVCDSAGNCATAGPIGGNMIDRRAPWVGIAAPLAGAVFTQGEVVPAAYNCQDNGSGLAFCTGPVANGSPIDTSTIGPRSLEVTGSDGAGNSGSASVAFTVTSAAPTITSLIDQVGRLTLPRAVKRALTATLVGANRAASRGAMVARALLRVFVLELRVLARRGVLRPAVANDLISKALTVASSL